MKENVVYVNNQPFEAKWLVTWFSHSSFENIDVGRIKMVASYFWLL